MRRFLVLLLVLVVGCGRPADAPDWRLNHFVQYRCFSVAVQPDGVRITLASGGEPREYLGSVQYAEWLPRGQVKILGWTNDNKSSHLKHGTRRAEIYIGTH